MQTFADQAVIAIENARLFDEVQAQTRDLTEALQQQTATAEVLKVISRSAFDLPRRAQQLTEAAVRTLPRDLRCKLPSQGRRLPSWREPCTFGLRGSVVEPAAQTYRNPCGRDPPHSRRVAADRRSRRISPTPGPIPNITARRGQLAGYRAMIGVPLMRKGELDRRFQPGAPEPEPSRERQIELVQTFADQAVIAIENVRLFDEVQARTRDLTEALQMQTATSDVLKVISRSAFDLQAVFNTLVSSAVELGGALTRHDLRARR